MLIAITLQLVWKGSKKVGFGVASGKVNGMYKKITVANYSPAGNMNIESSICANVDLADGKLLLQSEALNPR